MKSWSDVIKSLLDAFRFYSNFPQGQPCLHIFSDDDDFIMIHDNNAANGDKYEDDDDHCPAHY